MNLAQRILMARRRMCDAPDCDPYWGNVVLLLKGDGPDGSTNIIDSSINNHSVTVRGNARISTAQSVYPGGSSMYFDGNGSYMEIDPDNFIFGTNDFTIEMWYKSSTNVTTSLNTGLISHFPSVGSGQWGFKAVAHSNANYAFTYHNGSGFINLLMTERVADASWRYVSMSRSGTSLFFFRDGVLTDTHPIAANRPIQGPLTSKVRLGNFERDTTWLEGYIQDLRVTKGVARYTANFTPPTEPFPTTGP